MRTEDSQGRVDDRLIPPPSKPFGGMDTRTLLQISDRILAGKETSKEFAEFSELSEVTPSDTAKLLLEKQKSMRARQTPRTRNGVASSLYYLIKLASNVAKKDGHLKLRVREVGDLLLTTDLRDVFLITKDGEVHAPHMKTVALEIVGPSLTKRWAGMSQNSSLSRGSHSKGAE